MTERIFFRISHDLPMVAPFGTPRLTGSWGPGNWLRCGNGWERMSPEPWSSPVLKIDGKMTIDGQGTFQKNPKQAQEHFKVSGVGGVNRTCFGPMVSSCRFNQHGVQSTPEPSITWSNGGMSHFVSGTSLRANPWQIHGTSLFNELDVANQWVFDHLWYGDDS